MIESTEAPPSPKRTAGRVSEIDFRNRSRGSDMMKAGWEVVSERVPKHKDLDFVARSGLLISFKGGAHINPTAPPPPRWVSQLVEVVHPLMFFLVSVNGSSPIAPDTFLYDVTLSFLKLYTIACPIIHDSTSAH